MSFNLREIRGDIKVDTTRGRNNLTLASIDSLSVARVIIVESNKMMLAFPSDAVEEMLLLNPEQILTIAGDEFLSW